MKIEIKHRITGAALFATEVADGHVNPIRATVVSAVLAGADSYADLAGANLAGAYLSCADLVRVESSALRR
jgi:uncharacterized protein YjbI with pentapeptide repeats